jgi:type II secretory pathway component GspD/PulD (secretin)
VSGADQWTIKVYRLRYADAANIASTLRQNLLGPGEAAEITVDARTRSVIITASEKLQEEAAELIQQLDVEVLER